MEWTPLHMAARNGNSDIAKILLDQQANPNAIDKVSIKYLLYYVLVMCPLEPQCNQLPLQHLIISVLSLHLLQQ